jgi:hypothetical protein
MSENIHRRVAELFAEDQLGFTTTEAWIASTQKICEKYLNAEMCLFLESLSEEDLETRHHGRAGRHEEGRRRLRGSRRGSRRDIRGALIMYDERIATTEGWAVFHAHGTEDDGDLRLERVDETEIFATDDAVWRFVVGRARMGSALHYDALRQVFENNPSEKKAILDHCEAEGIKIPEGLA